ncbi:MAG TPA: hypothetical protein PLT03_00810 [Bacillota bacterium]|nr:hypothetical protein [Bacillota bacterium]HOA15054.1 hypothetical protein [Bacillota bacterium]HOG52393.1 hypothetical protein [Bacillota bacterium]
MGIEVKGIENDGSGLLGITAKEACEALADPELGCSAAAAAAVVASCGAALIVRAAIKCKHKAASTEDLINKAMALSLEINSMAKRLDMADEISKPVSGDASKEALSASLDSSVSLLEASYFGQSLARSVAEGITREGAVDLGVAAMLLDAGAGAAMLSAREILAKADDEALSKKTEEMVWAITHDRIGLKKQTLGIVDDILNKGPEKDS